MFNHEHRLRAQDRDQSTAQGALGLGGPCPEACTSLLVDSSNIFREVAFELAIELITTARQGGRASGDVLLEAAVGVVCAPTERPMRVQPGSRPPVVTVTGFYIVDVGGRPKTKQGGSLGRNRRGVPAGQPTISMLAIPHIFPGEPHGTAQESPAGGISVPLAGS